MPVSQTSLAEALAGRLCHDLAGLAGTVSGMLELAEDAAERTEALALAREAAAGLAGRLRVARAAWGRVADWPPGGFGGLVSGLATDRLKVVPDAATLALGQQAATGRLLLNVALLGMERLGNRGAILMHAEPGGVAVTLALPGPAGPPDWPASAGSLTPEPRHFQHAWTFLVAAEHGTRLRPVGPILHLLLSA